MDRETIASASPGPPSRCAQHGRTFRAPSADALTVTTLPACTSVCCFERRHSSHRVTHLTCLRSLAHALLARSSLGAKASLPCSTSVAHARSLTLALSLSRSHSCSCSPLTLSCARTCLLTRRSLLVLTCSHVGSEPPPSPTLNRPWRLVQVDGEMHLVVGDMLVATVPRGIASCNLCAGVATGCDLPADGSREPGRWLVVGMPSASEHH